MKKKLIGIGAIGTVACLIMIGILAQNVPVSDNDDDESLAKDVQIDVVMPTKVSRPGCELDDRCYVPSLIVTQKGKPVTWINEDSAFHSVTSGFYDSPTSLFDSGYLDPFETFTLTFEESGTFDYFCTLHPWMEGKVIVE